MPDQALAVLKGGMAMLPNGSNAVLPTALDNLGASQVPHRNPAIVCDAATDNQPAIQAAVDALAAVPTGGIVELPNCNKIAIANEIHVHTSRVAIEGVPTGGHTTWNNPSNWYNRSGITGTVLGWTGSAGGTMVRYEPNAADTAIVGGGLNHIVLAGLGSAGTLLKIRTMREGDWDVIGDNCTGNCYDLGVTTNALAANEYCDTQRNRFWRLQYYQFAGMSTAVDNSNGLVMSGLLSASAPGGGSPTPYGCAASTIEANASFNDFYSVDIWFKNGNGVTLKEAVDNHFFSPMIQKNSGGTGKGIDLQCADSVAGIWQARRNTFYTPYSNGAITSEACTTSYNSIGDSAHQNRLYGVSTSASGQKPAFSGYAADASLYWDSTDGDGNDHTRLRPPYVVGKLYLPEDAFSGTVVNGSAPGASKIVCFAGNISRNISLDHLAVRVATLDAAGHVSTAIYADNGGAPGTLLSSTASTPTTSASVLNVTLAAVATPNVGPGSAFGRTYWFCENTDSATAAFGTFSLTAAQATMIGTTVPADALNAGIGAISCSGAACNGGSSTYGSWPASLAGSTWSDVVSAGYAAIAFQVNALGPK